MRTRSILVAAALLASLPVVNAPIAKANHKPISPIDASQLDYSPIGYYGPADEAGTPFGESTTIPMPSSGPPTLNNPNPSGKWIPYDTNVWESLTLPYRHASDNCNSIPAEDRLEDCLSGDRDDDESDPEARTGYTGYAGPSGTSTVHGTCPPSPEIPGPWGQCFNNQLEYLEHYKYSMESSFEDLGMIVKIYPFEHVGGGLPRGAALAAAAGQAYNISATIPGADHPDETVLVGAHFDQTDSGPASAWDSAEGHTEIMRMAYIMADYYRKTGTRPSTTLKFIPWDAEEAGAFGSEHYAANNIPPGEEAKVRAYFNVDPCAGAYPAFEEGTNRQIREVLQLANPANFQAQPEIKARMEAFNTEAVTWIDEVLDRLDDRMTRPGGAEVPIFVSNAEATAGSDDRGSLGGVGSDRGKIVTAIGGLLAFTSDYRNFERIGIPVFNLFPDMLGPHANGSASDSVKGIQILHTNEDNLRRINVLTSATTGVGPAAAPDLSGLTASEGWAKGMEFCAQVEAWGMLQPEMAGAQGVDNSPVAYFEALPNEAIVNQGVTFDATGTYQYANPGTRAMEPGSALSYQWDFGDGSTGTGKTLEHKYDAIGRYNAKLTVTGAGGRKDSMTIPITVVGSNFPGPILDVIPESEAEDGNFSLKWEFTGDKESFDRYGIEESSDYQALLDDEAEDITKNWNVEPPPAGIQPWQHSDSGTPKFFRNAHRSGARSFWTGFSPPFPQPPTVVPGRSILTLKNPITVPAGGEVELSYWSLFKNESDDSAQVQLALTTGSTPPDQLDWQTVDSIPGGTNVCSPSEPESLLEELENHRIDVSQFKGKKILLRFVYISGATNPAASQPCGWYVDDISLYHGTWNQIGTSKKEGFTVTNRRNGTYGYRVKAIYADGVSTQASNVEVAKVTKSKRLRGLARCLKHKGNVVLGSAGEDKLVGTKRRDVLCGFSGKDKIAGLGGRDVVLAGRGNDIVRGGKGNDTLLGEKGKDWLLGGQGKDRLKGGKGRDRLDGGPGNDRCGGKSDRIRRC